MFNRKRLFTLWWAPVIGAVIVPLILILVDRSDELLFKGARMSIYLIGGAMFGGLVGLMVPLSNPPNSSVQAGDSVAPSTGDARRGTLVSRFIAIVSLGFFFAVPLSLILGLVAVYMNRNVRGWPRTVSWIGLVLSISFLLLSILLRVYRQR
jgi:hypothetical protein